MHDPFPLCAQLSSIKKEYTQNQNSSKLPHFLVSSHLTRKRPLLILIIRIYMYFSLCTFRGGKLEGNHFEKHLILVI